MWPVELGLLAGFLGLGCSATDGREGELRSGHDDAIAHCLACPGHLGETTRRYADSYSHGCLSSTNVR